MVLIAPLPFNIKGSAAKDIPPESFKTALLETVVPADVAPKAFA